MVCSLDETIELCTRTQARTPVAAKYRGQQTNTDTILRIRAACTNPSGGTSNSEVSVTKKLFRALPEAHAKGVLYYNLVARGSYCVVSSTAVLRYARTIIRTITI